MENSDHRCCHAAVSLYLSDFCKMVVRTLYEVVRSKLAAKIERFENDRRAYKVKGRLFAPLKTGWFFLKHVNS